MEDTWWSGASSKRRRELATSGSRSRRVVAHRAPADPANLGELDLRDGLAGVQTAGDDHGPKGLIGLITAGGFGAIPHRMPSCRQSRTQVRCNAWRARLILIGRGSLAVGYAV